MNDIINCNRHHQYSQNEKPKNKSRIAVREEMTDVHFRIDPNELREFNFLLKLNPFATNT